MRTAPAAALLVLLAAPLAAPAQGKGDDPVFRTTYFEVTLPKGWPRLVEQEVPQAGLPTRAYVSAAPRAVLAVMQMTLPPLPADTALEAQRHAFRSIRGDILGLGGFSAAGEPQEILRPDRLTYRMRGTARAPDGTEVPSVLDVSLSRRGARHVWMVFQVVPAVGTREPTAEGLSFMDSFRLRPDAPPPFPPDGTDVFRWIEGRWEWTASAGPAPPPFRLRAAADRRTIRLDYDAGPEKGDTATTHVYEVLGHGPNHVRGRIVGETRRDAAGAPVVWDFLRLSKDLFCWRRVDLPYDCTRAIRRVGSAPVEPARPKPSPPSAPPRSETRR